MVFCIVIMGVKGNLGLFDMMRSDLRKISEEKVILVVWSDFEKASDFSSTGSSESCGFG